MVSGDAGPRVRGIVYDIKRVVSPWSADDKRLRSTFPSGRLNRWSRTSMNTTSSEHDHSTVQEKAEAADQAATPPQRVLVADDDPSIREILELILSDDGYEVISAGN